MTEELYFYTSAEVAGLLRLNVQVVQRKLQAGEIPGYRIGKEWRVERAQLLEWLGRHSNQRAKSLSDRWFEPSGRLKALPAQRAKRRAVLERVAELFDPGRSYKEAEVNKLLRGVFDDFAYLRRELIAENLVDRTGGIYRRTYTTPGLSTEGPAPSESHEGPKRE
jgi:excisionase family DNA binding protein